MRNVIQHLLYFAPVTLVYSWPNMIEGVVSRKVCFSGYQNCCYRHIMINVRNCSSFFVYRLKPVQVCHSRYCGGKAGGWNTNLVFKNTVYHYTLIFSRLLKTVRPFKELSFRILKEAWSRLCRIIRVKFMRDAILSAGIIYNYFSFFS